MVTVPCLSRNIKKDGMEWSRNLLPELVRGVRPTSGTGFSRLPCDFLSTLLFLLQPVLPTTKGDSWTVGEVEFWIYYIIVITLEKCTHRMPSGVRERHSELATLKCIRTQCNSEGKVAKYSRFFRPLLSIVLSIVMYGYHLSVVLQAIWRRSRDAYQVPVLAISTVLPYRYPVVPFIKARGAAL
jgi:hypothetical protein